VNSAEVQGLSIVTVQLPPNSVTPFEFSARSFQILEVSNAAAIVASLNGSPDMELIEDLGAEVPLDEPVSYFRWRLINTSASIETVKFAYSLQSVRNNRSSIRGAVEVKSGDTVVTGATNCTGTVTTISNQNLSRNAIILTNTDPVETVFIGSSSVTVANGFPLLPGQSMTISSSAWIRGITSGAAVAVRRLEVLG
jgi:hypothetical protein